MEESVDDIADSGEQEELSKLTERKLKIRRRAVLLAIATIFTVTAIILIITVVQEEINKRYGYQELVCQEQDEDCLSLLCPQGWEYLRDQDQCKVKEGEELQPVYHSISFY